jgi:YggT family protein
VYALGYFLIAIAKILGGLLWAYMWIVIIRALLSWVRPDPYNPIVRFINGLVDPVSYRISRIIPTRIGMMDIAPLILIVLIYFLQAFLVPVIRETGIRLLP